MNSIIRDDWLSGIYGRDTFKLSADDSFIDDKEFGPEQLWSYLSRNGVFIYAKVSPASRKCLRYLEKTGFFIVDTNVTYDKKIATQFRFNGKAEIRFAVPGDEDACAELAARSFSFSRFHADDRLKEKANLVKAEWVRNYFRGKRGDQMVVAAIKGELVGFLQLIKADKTLTIDLIATDQAQRRKGIAADMITFAEQNCSGCDRMVVGTQIANYPSMRFYQNIGFIFHSASYVIHYHN